MRKIKDNVEPKIINANGCYTIKGGMVTFSRKVNIKENKYGMYKFHWRETLHSRLSRFIKRMVRK